MATVEFTASSTGKIDSQNVSIVRWDFNAAAVGDVGEKIELPGSSEKSVQISGSNFNGATILFEGSNDGDDWFTLNDAFGAPISAAVNKLVSVNENTRFVRPKNTVAEATDVSVTLVAKR